MEQGLGQALLQASALRVTPLRGQQVSAEHQEESKQKY
jgi:hypothetical protein